MISEIASPAVDVNVEISALIETLLATEQRLEELTGGEVDTVAGRDGRTFVLRRAQDQLRQNEATKQADILNALPAHIALLDGQGLIVSVNEAWRSFADASLLPALAHGIGLNYLTTCNQARGAYSSEAQQVAEGIRAVLDGARKSFSTEYPCHSPTEHRWFLLSVTPLASDHRNGAVVMHLDITERRESEIASSRLAAIVESSNDAIIGKDLTGIITSWNKGAENIFGYSASEMVRTSIRRLIPAERAGEEDEILRKIARGERIEHFETQRLTKDRGLIDVSVTASFIKDGEGKIVGIAKVARDITARKLMEVELKQARDAALESVRLKSEFLANMSHEIRTPMNGVIGMTDLLLETDLTPSQREDTVTIQSSAEALLIIINDILDFSKIEAGMMRFENIDFELRGSVEAPVELLAERAQVKGLELASLVHSDVPTALKGDPGRLRQVLTNLIGNAVKFTNRGEVVVTVTKVSESTTSVMLRFEIRDSGIGISAEVQKVLFQPFTQADGSTTRKHGGTGLGLAISKQLIELMGGEVGIESMPGDGSTFWFTSRFDKQLNLTISAEPAGTLSGARVLIVEDNVANRNILNHQTTSWGMIATEAESGKQALELLRAGVVKGEPFDIAVLDLMMPDIDGFQLAEAIKSDPTIAPVALVLLPPFGKRGHGERAKQAGIAAYLPKPVRQSHLHDCLSEVMDQSFSNESALLRTLVTRHSLREAELKQKVKTFSSLRILIAEDNPVNQKVALRQLYSLGYRAEAVPNGRELLRALESCEVDIILMDCQMPDMDGFAATAEIRRREGTARHTQIIAMTANALDGDREACLAAGMDDYLSKPVKSEALRLKLERWSKPHEAEKVRGDYEAIQGTRGNVIDHTQLASLREIQEPGEPDFVTEVIDLFLNETEVHLRAMREAVTNNDAISLRRLAHLLEGSSANVGATQMVALYNELVGMDHVNGNSGALLTSLAREFELVRVALNAERR